MIRYLIAIPLPQTLADELRRRYQETYHDRLRVRFIHTTILPPFTVDNTEQVQNLEPLQFIHQKINEIQPWDTQFRFGNPGIFQNKHIPHSRRILYLPIVSERANGSTSLTTSSSPLQQAYEQLLTTLRPHITFAATDFKTNQLPEFKAHVTLSYSFSNDPSLFIPLSESFKLPQPELLQEAGPRLWTRVETGS